MCPHCPSALKESRLLGAAERALVSGQKVAGPAEGKRGGCGSLSSPERQRSLREARVEGDEVDLGRGAGVLGIDHFEYFVFCNTI